MLMQRVGYTKWERAGMSGTMIGLQWGVMFTMMDKLGLDDTAWQDLHDDLQVMEEAALLTIREFEPKPSKS